MQNYQEVEVLNQKLQAEILKNYQEVGVFPRITGRDIAKLSRGGSIKPSLQANISKNPKDTWKLPYTTYSHKYKPTEDDPRKDWKKLRLSGGD